MMSRRFDNTYEVCSCRSVTLGEIIYAIKEKNAQTLGEIQEITDAGTECRCCICEEGDYGKVKKKLYCKEILDKLGEKSKK